MRILGIDPGLHLTGYALLTLHPRGPALEEAGVLRIGTKEPLPNRLHQLHLQMSQLLIEFPCDHMAVEQLYAHYKHPRTAILMGHARGAILLAAAQANIPITSLSSTLVKKMVTGNGHATKRQMQLAVAALYRLARPPSPPDVADAIAIAWTLAAKLQRHR